MTAPPAAAGGRGPLAVYAVAEALRARLEAAWRGGPVPGVRDARALVLSSAELTDAAALDGVLSVHVYRVSHSPAAHGHPEAPPSLDAHLLIAAFSRSALAEAALVAFAAAELHRSPVLEVPGRDGLAGGAVELVPLTLPDEELSALWRGLRAPRRLSLAYVARGVVIGDPPRGAA